MTLQQIWFCHAAESEQKWGAEAPVLILPDMGVLTETCHRNGNKELRIFRLRSLDSGAVISTFTQDGSVGHPIGSDSSSKYLATSTAVWNVLSGKRIAELTKPEDHVSESVAVSPEGRAVLSAGTSGEILIYKIGDPTSEQQVQPSVLGRVHAGSAHHVAFSPDGTRALAVDLHIQSWFVWDTSNLKLLSCIRMQETPTPAAIHAPWKGFFGQTALVDWDTGRTICEIKPPEPGRLTEARLLTDKKGILAYFQGDRTDFYRNHALCLYDMSGSRFTTRPLSSSLFPAAFSPDGEYMATLDLVPAPPPYPGLEALDKEAQGPIRCWRVQVK